mgnify:CR=1 FL=1
MIHCCNSINCSELRVDDTLFLDINDDASSRVTPFSDEFGVVGSTVLGNNDDIGVIGLGAFIKFSGTSGKSRVTNNGEQPDTNNATASINGLFISFPFSQRLRRRSYGKIRRVAHT